MLEECIHLLFKFARHFQMALIVVADDCRLTRMLIREALESHGHEIIDAKDGVECVQAVNTLMPDLLIVDCFMPKMDGMEAIIELKETHKTLKIIGISSCMSPSGIEIGKSPYVNALKLLGASYVLEKPFLPHQLQKLVEISLG